MSANYVQILYRIVLNVFKIEINLHVQALLQDTFQIVIAYVKYVIAVVLCVMGPLNIIVPNVNQT